MAPRKKLTTKAAVAPATKSAVKSDDPALPPVADRGAMHRAVLPLVEGKSCHPETMARIVEQTSRYAEHAVRQAFRETKER